MDIKVEVTHVRFEGQLRFYESDLLEQSVDHIAIGIDQHGVEEIVSLEEVEHDELFRRYTSFMPVEKLGDEIDENIIFAPISTDPNLPLVFKPASRKIKTEVSFVSPEKNTNAHFKVIMGTWVAGSTTPPVPNAIVRIQRVNAVSLRDRTPT